MKSPNQTMNHISCHILNTTPSLSIIS